MHFSQRGLDSTGEGSISCMVHVLSLHRIRLGPCWGVKGLCRMSSRFQDHTVTRKRIRSPEHPCPKHNSIRVPRACGHQSINAQTIIAIVFQEYTVTKASMPKPQKRSCSKSIRSPEHPCPNHNSDRVPRVYGHRSIHAQTIIAFVFQEHAVTGESMPKP